MAFLLIEQKHLIVLQTSREVDTAFEKCSLWYSFLIGRTKKTICFIGAIQTARVQRSVAMIRRSFISSFPNVCDA